MSEYQPSAALRAEVTRDLERLARRRRSRMGMFCLLGLGLTVGFGFGLGARHPEAASIGWWISLSAFAASGLLLCAYAFGISIPSRRRLPPFLVAGVSAGLIILGLSIRTESSPLAFFAGAHCLGMGFGISIAVVVVALLLGRRVLRRHAPTGLLLGVGAGLLGMVPLHVACVHTSADHLMVWHALVPIVSGLFGGLAWIFLEPDPAQD